MVSSGLPGAEQVRDMLAAQVASAAGGFTFKGPAQPVLSSGFRALDKLLPAGGVRRGSLLEWLAATEASGAAALASAVACRMAAAPAGGAILIVDRRGLFHPPAVLPWLEEACGGRSEALAGRLVVVRPKSDDDELWAIDQALRCGGVAAVLAWPQRVHPTALRRWQLAAKAGGAVGLLVRPQAVQQESSWAEARVRVSGALGGTLEGGGTDSLSLRRLRLTLVGGPWLGAGHMEEHSADIVLDLARGRDGALPERDGALPERDGALPERDGALPERDGALPERDGALRALPQPGATRREGRGICRAS